jgi:hypothetical protein
MSARRPTLPLSLSSPSRSAVSHAGGAGPSTVKKRASLARTPPHPAQPPSDDENSQSSANGHASSAAASRPHNPFQKVASAAHAKPTHSAHSHAGPVLSLGASQSARGAAGPLSPQFSRPLARKMARCDNTAPGGSQSFAGSQSQQSQAPATARAPLKQSVLSFPVAANRQQLFVSQSQDNHRGDAPSSQLLFSQPMPTPLYFNSARSEPEATEERQTLSLTQSMGMWSWTRGLFSCTFCEATVFCTRVLSF